MRQLRKTKDMDKWQIRFFNLARQYSTWSKDPSKQIGCIAVRGKKPIAYGYNGFPSSISDFEEHLNNDEFRRKWMIHAEINMISNAAREGISLEGCDIYIWGLQSCHECAKALQSCGVKGVYAVDAYEDPKWTERFYETESFFYRSRIDTWHISSKKYEEACLQVGK